MMRPSNSLDPTPVGDLPEQESGSSSFDPFRSSNPPVIVHDVDADVFERAWEGAEGDTVRCPVCRNGEVDARGAAPLDQRQWVRFSCGDFIAQEMTAG